MNITVVFTGGTIGSLQKQSWIGLDAAATYKLLQPFQERYPDICFTTKSPYNILSENLSGRELNLLQGVVAASLGEQPDGIIITHGTDTLQYTATAMEYAFADAAVPIVFVSAAYPLEYPETNGYLNFEAAVELIRTRCTGGVYVSYKNDDQAHVNLHYASRLLQHGEQSANLYSLNNEIYAIYDGKITVNKQLLPKSVSCGGIVEYCDPAGILTVESVPGNGYDYALERVRAILLKPYHSATLNTESPFFVQFCRRARERNIPIVVIGAAAGIPYESTKFFGELGIHVVPFGTYASLYIYLWRGISLEVNLLEYLKG